MQLLHMNRQASELAKQINVAEHGGGNSRAAHGVLPTALTELCGEIVKALHIRTEAKDWEQFEIKRERALVDFQIPYFHMREFAHSTGVFEDWKGKETKRRKLFVKLIKAGNGVPDSARCDRPKDVYDSTYSQFPDFKKGRFFST
jgi:hypothetical protein